ncbi:hypothetical protein [Demequina aestuarii]|uniref:hypothetical protein n=1 Tax=Demequina aestuarii TaxID=327095 RepID=UPI000785652D|nr:hypothetical protein [Demequina aestuarii]
MIQDSGDSTAIGGLWFTMALLAGGLARTRGRSGLAWFFLTLFLGPFGALFLVLLPMGPRAPH